MKSECSAARSARVPRAHDVVGSNPATPTVRAAPGECRQKLHHEPEPRVRLPRGGPRPAAGATVARRYGRKAGRFSTPRRRMRRAPVLGRTNIVAIARVRLPRATAWPRRTNAGGTTCLDARGCGFDSHRSGCRPPPNRTVAQRTERDNGFITTRRPTRSLCEPIIEPTPEQAGAEPHGLCPKRRPGSGS